MKFEAWVYVTYCQISFLSIYVEGERSTNLSYLTEHTDTWNRKGKQIKNIEQRKQRWLPQGRCKSGYKPQGLQDKLKELEVQRRAGADNTVCTLNKEGQRL